MAEKGQQETRSQTPGSQTPEGRSQNGGAASRSAGLGQAAEGMQEAAQRTGEQTERSARTGSQALRRGGEAGAEAVRQASDAGAETMRHLSSTTQEAVQRGTHAAIESQQQIAHDAAGQIEQIGVQLAQALQENARDMRALFGLPSVSTDGMQDLRQGVNTLMEGMVRTNLRLMQDVFRTANATWAVDLQRRYAGEYLDTVLNSSASLLRATRRVAEDALQPLEQRVQERQQQRQGQQGERQDGGQHRQQAAPSGRVADVMAKEVRLASPDDTVQRAAQLMREEDTGFLPVGEGDRLVGTVTDRDVAVRLVAEGRDPRQTRVRDVMTPEVRYVFDDEDLGNVAENMAEQQLRRLPVVDREKRLVGVISLGDFARGGKPQLAGRAYSGIARQRGQHSQHAAE